MTEVTHFLPGSGCAYLHLQVVITACPHCTSTPAPSCYRKTSEIKNMSNILVIEYGYHPYISCIKEILWWYTDEKFMVKKVFLKVNFSLSAAEFVKVITVMKEREEHLKGSQNIISYWTRKDTC